MQCPPDFLDEMTPKKLKPVPRARIAARDTKKVHTYVSVGVVSEWRSFGKVPALTKKARKRNRAPTPFPLPVQPERRREGEGGGGEELGLPPWLAGWVAKACAVN